MLDHPFYVELKQWQTVIGSVLGFLALTWGALFNYHLGRKRDDRVRNIECVSIAIGIYGEVQQLSAELAKMANGIGGWYLRSGIRGDSAPQHFSGNWVLPDPLLYKALAPKLGMLPSIILEPLIKFYAYYNEAITHFPKILSDEERPVSYGVGWVLDPALRAIDEVQPALREIEKLGQIEGSPPMPTLDKAREAKNLEDEMHPDC